MDTILTNHATIFEMMVAVGCAGRFTPLQLGGAEIASEARALWGALPPGAHDEAVTSALLRIDSLMDDLPELRSRVAADPVMAAPLALDWLRRRDDLESILFLARGTGAAPVLEDALKTLDECAAAEHSIWFFLPPFDDERLRAVAAAEPDAWWGDLAVK